MWPTLTSVAGGSSNTYGVKLVRGPFVKLASHPDHVTSVADLEALCLRLRGDAPDRHLAADLFSGGGGLSLGLRDAGVDVVLSVDHYREAVETHAHHFPGLSVDWDLADADRVERVADTMTACGIDVLVGGPPCQPFSKAGRSGIRYRVQHGLREPLDRRRDLWRSFLEVVRLSRPRAVVMENVPDMALDTDMFILRAIVEDLEQLGYAVEERIVDAWRYGVPQFRQRLIVVGLADRVRFEWPDEVRERVTVWNAIGDLPEVEGGWRPEGGAEGWTPYTNAAPTSFQAGMRAGVPGADSGKLFDHITRPVREDDARAFELMDSDTRYSELPDDVKRYRDDIFDDKYKRLNENDLSRTITAHIAKDGYWYIHPRQGRTLTVREAARLQTFPDWYRFSGPPSAAFHQIGNAVPPALGRKLGEAVLASLATAAPAPPSTQEISAALATWFRRQTVLQVPWLRADTRWQVVSAGILLDRSPSDQVRSVWPVLRMWRTPEDTLAAEATLEGIGRLTGRTARVEQILDLARDASMSGTGPDVPPTDLAVGKPLAELAVLVVPDAEDTDEGGGEPVLARGAMLRVASRFTGEDVDVRNKLTDGRLAVARLIGDGGDARDAQLGVVEIAAAVCRPAEPLCELCPLASWCASASMPTTLWDDGDTVHTNR